MEQVVGGVWPFVVAVVLIPLVFALLRRLGAVSDEERKRLRDDFDQERRENKESHGVLHRKVEELAERLRIAEVTQATIVGQLKAIEDVPTRREFESALGGVRDELKSIRDLLGGMTSVRFRTGRSGESPAVRDPRRE